MAALTQGPLSLQGTDPGSITVRVRAMGAAACLAEAMGEVFVQYYSGLMPGLLASAQLATIELAGAAVEAATIVGQAVGKEIFQADAQQLLAWILPVLQQQQALQEGGADSSPILEPLLLACARIASVLEEDFAPHAQTVLPILLHRVQQAPDLSIMVSNDA